MTIGETKKAIQEAQRVYLSVYMTDTARMSMIRTSVKISKSKAMMLVKQVKAHNIHNITATYEDGTLAIEPSPAPRLNG